MSENGERHNEGKPKLYYNSLGMEIQEGEARVWEAGAKEYAPGNWLKGMPITETIDSLRRHTDKFLNGEDIDQKSGLAHVFHMICCAKIIANSYVLSVEAIDKYALDDRPSRQNKLTVHYGGKNHE